MNQEAKEVAKKNGLAKKKKKINIKLSRGSIIVIGGVLLLIFIIVIISLIVSSVTKKAPTANRSAIKEFSSDAIINNIKINDTSVASLNSLKDFKNKLKAEIMYVNACTKKEKCTAYLMDDFDIKKAEKNKIYKLSFWFVLNDASGNPMYFDFYTYFDAYKDMKENVHYYLLTVSRPTTMVSLDGVQYKDLTRDIISSKYKLSKESNEYVYYVNFTSKDKDKYVYSAGSSSTTFEIRNKTEEEIYK